MTDQPDYGCTINGQPAMPILVADYNQLAAAAAEAASTSDLRRQLDAAIAALGKSETELAALRAVARGYCPECGRGDAGPTAADWEAQRRRAERAEAKVADYENRITWHTTCESCARILDSCIRETERAERAETALARIQAIADEHPAGIDTALIHEALDLTETDIDRMMAAGTPVRLVTAPPLTWTTAQDFYEPDEDPASVKAAFDAGPKGVTGPGPAAAQATEPAGLRQPIAAAVDRAFDAWQQGLGETRPQDAVTDTVLAAVTEYLDIGDAQAWCKTCRRAWNNPAHQCESDGEQRVQQIAKLRDQWLMAGPPPLGTSINRWWDKRLVELNAALGEEPGPA